MIHFSSGMTGSGADGIQFSTATIQFSNNEIRFSDDATGFSGATIWIRPDPLRLGSGKFKFYTTGKPSGLWGWRNVCETEHVKCLFFFCYKLHFLLYGCTYFCTQLYNKLKYSTFTKYILNASWRTLMQFGSLFILTFKLFYNLLFNMFFWHVDIIITFRFRNQPDSPWVASSRTVSAGSPRSSPEPSVDSSREDLDMTQIITHTLYSRIHQHQSHYE